MSGIPVQNLGGISKPRGSGTKKKKADGLYARRRAGCEGRKVPAFRQRTRIYCLAGKIREGDLSRPQLLREKKKVVSILNSTE